MRGVYTAIIRIDTLNSARTLILVGNPATMCAEILSASASNRDTETNEQIDCAITQLDTPDTNIDQGTLITPRKSENGDAAWAGTCVGNFTIEPGTYEDEHIDSEGTPGLSGYHYDPLPEERVVVSPGKYFGLRILTAPAQFKATCKIKWRAIGG